jgi:hypothetical protein
MITSQGIAIEHLLSALAIENDKIRGARETEVVFGFDALGGAGVAHVINVFDENPGVVELVFIQQRDNGAVEGLVLVVVNGNFDLVRK